MKYYTINNTLGFVQREALAELQEIIKESRKYQIKEGVI